VQGDQKETTPNGMTLESVVIRLRAVIIFTQWCNLLFGGVGIGEKDSKLVLKKDA